MPPGGRGRATMQRRSTYTRIAAILFVRGRALSRGVTKVRLSAASLFEEEPAVTVEILGAVARARRARFDAGQDRGAGGLRPREVALEVVHVHEDAIDDPGHRRPLAGLLAALPVAPGSLVVGCRRRQHDEAVAGQHFAVREAPVWSGETR